MVKVPIFIVFQSLMFLLLHSDLNKKNASRPTRPIVLGAYYFDGWDGSNKASLTPKLLNEFQDRRPIWGWNTSTSEVIESQIELAANAGFSFFSFCWYTEKDGDYENPIALNNALKLYLNAKNKNRLNFSIMVANHAGFTIGPNEWANVITYWCTLFKNPYYQKVNDKPLITFFSMQSLIKEFGSEEAVNKALADLKNKAIQEGLPGVATAVVVNASPVVVKKAEQCGFDILTGYNYHGEGLKTSKNELVPIDSMRTTERNIWSSIAKVSNLPVIPVITVNWDHRPWDKDDITSSPRFVNYSRTSIKKAIRGCRYWIKQNPNETSTEKIALVYAWNEYGEGAWLTPSKASGNKLLKGVKDGLQH